VGKKHLRLHPKVHTVPADSQRCRCLNHTDRSSTDKAINIKANPDVMGQPDNGHTWISCTCNLTTNRIVAFKTAPFKRPVHHIANNVQTHHWPGDFPSHRNDGSCVCWIKTYS
jgi:hypothetical protein